MHPASVRSSRCRSAAPTPASICASIASTAASALASVRRPAAVTAVSMTRPCAGWELRRFAQRRQARRRNQDFSFGDGDDDVLLVVVHRECSSHGANSRSIGLHDERPVRTFRDPEQCSTPFQHDSSRLLRELHAQLRLGIELQDAAVAQGHFPTLAALGFERPSTEAREKQCECPDSQQGGGNRTHYNPSSVRPASSLSPLRRGRSLLRELHYGFLGGACGADPCPAFELRKSVMDVCDA